jgi:hypothetical protein
MKDDRNHETESGWGVAEWRILTVGLAIAMVTVFTLLYFGWVLGIGPAQ